jgi:predicted nuclease of predicted toxin-antitoxin system
MKLLLDQGTPRRTAAWLRQSGWDAVHTGEAGLSTAEDAQILEIARKQERVVVTLDADFHTMIAIRSYPANFT